MGLFSGLQQLLQRLQQVLQNLQQAARRCLRPGKAARSLGG